MMSRRRYSVPSLRVENQTRWNNLSDREKDAINNKEILRQFEALVKFQPKTTKDEQS